MRRGARRPTLSTAALGTAAAGGPTVLSRASRQSCERAAVSRTPPPPSSGASGVAWAGGAVARAGGWSRKD
eukprot:2252272-Prymnesium_polylepis.1